MELITYLEYGVSSTTLRNASISPSHQTHCVVPAATGLETELDELPSGSSAAWTLRNEVGLLTHFRNRIRGTRGQPHA